MVSSRSCLASGKAEEFFQSNRPFKSTDWGVGPRNGSTVHDGKTSLKGFIGKFVYSSGKATMAVGPSILLPLNKTFLWFTGFPLIIDLNICYDITGIGLNFFIFSCFLLGYAELNTICISL